MEGPGASKIQKIVNFVRSYLRDKAELDSNQGV